MKTMKISGSLRVNVGTKDADALRREGKVPCVLYGGKEQIHFSVIEKDFKNLVYSPDVFIVKLDVGGKQCDAVMQEIQFHKVSDHIIHMDFLEVVPGKPIVVEIPIKITGTSEGVREGGKLVKKLTKLKAKALAEKMPENVVVDITKLKIGDSIRVSDIKVDGVQFLNAPNVTVVAVKITRAVVEEAPKAAAAAAPAAAPAAAAKKDEKKDEKKK